MKNVEEPTRFAPGRVNLVCVKCMRGESFPVFSLPETQRAIAKGGWVQRDGKSICPKCPK